MAEREQDESFRQMFERESREKEEWLWSRRNSGDKECNHEMQYSSTLGVVGGICRKCGYKTY